jgi:peptide/nickel transport system substrate-binding protein
VARAPTATLCSDAAIGNLSATSAGKNLMAARILFIAVASLALAAALPPAPARAAGDTLIVGLSQFPPDMNPDFVATDAKIYLLNIGQRPIAQYDIDGHVVCRLCTEVPTLANGGVTVQAQPDGTKQMETTWTLRPDLFWGDGVPVTTADAALAFEVSKAIDPNNAMDRLDIVDAHTFRIHRRALHYDFDTEILPGSNYLLPAHIEAATFHAATSPLDYAQHSAYDRAPETPGLWLGPYRVTGYNSASELTGEPNPYWRGKPVAYKRLVIRLVERTPALEANLLSGDIDVMAELGLPLTQIVNLEKQHGDRFEVYYRTTGFVEHLAPALWLPPLNDRRVRQAVLMGIDRATIAAKLFDGHEDVAHALLGPNEPDYDPSVKRWNYDPAAARKLLADAGFHSGADGILVGVDGARLSIPMTTTAGNTLRELEEAVMQSQLKAIGVELVIKNEPARTMFGQTLRQRAFTGFVMYSRTPAPGAVPWGFLGSRYIPTAENGYFGTNYQGYANPEMDAVLDAARQELDPIRRKADWKRIHAMVAEDLPILPLFYYTLGYVQAKTMSGIIPPPLGASASAWIEDWRPR